MNLIPEEVISKVNETSNERNFDTATQPTKGMPAVKT